MSAANVLSCHKKHYLNTIILNEVSDSIVLLRAGARHVIVLHVITVKLILSLSLCHLVRESSTNLILLPCRQTAGYCYWTKDSVFREEHLEYKGLD